MILYPETTAINRLKAAGVRIIFEEENLDTDEVDSNLIISVMESLAQAENESRSENIRLGLAMRAANGIYRHGYTLGFCYTRISVSDERVSSSNNHRE